MSQLDQTDQPEQVRTLYHGTRDMSVTPETLEERDPNYSGSMGRGIYLGQSHDTAAYYSGGTGNVMEVPVALKNPLHIDAEDGVNYRMDPETEDLYNETGNFDTIIQGERVPAFDVMIGGEWHEIRGPHDLSNLRHWAERHGHDSIIARGLRHDSSVPDEEVLVFDKGSLRVKPR